MSTGYPSIPEHGLTPQGRIYRRSVSTDEKLHEIAPEFRGTGATPQEKADHTKAWISKENATGEKENESSSTTRAQHDTYAQELNKRLGPVSSVMDSLQDGIGAAKESISGDGKTIPAAADGEMDGESQNSVSGSISKYTQAAWDKVNDLKPSTLGGAKEQQMTEAAEKAREHTSDGSIKLLAAGGDDVSKTLSDGASTQEDSLKANLRVTTEAVS